MIERIKSSQGESNQLCLRYIILYRNRKNPKSIGDVNPFDAGSGFWKTMGLPNVKFNTPNASIQIEEQTLIIRKIKHMNSRKM